MNRTVIAVILLLVAVGIGIFSLAVIDKYCDRTVERLDKILENAVNENAEEVNSLAVQANEEWEKEKSLLNVLIGLGGTNDITDDMQRMMWFSQIGDLNSVILYAEECKVDFKIIKESAEPNLSTIF